MPPMVGVGTHRQMRAPTEDPTDAEARRLTFAVARGDETAFGELYDRYHDRVFRLVVVLSRGDDSLAHELVQSVMLTAARKLRPLGSEAHLWNWLAMVVRQHLSKARRHQQRDSVIVSMADPPEPSDTGEPDSAIEESLDAAVKELDPEDRQVVELFYFEGLRHKEIADRLGATPKAVSCRLERVRIKLRAIIIRRLSHET